MDARIWNWCSRVGTRPTCITAVRVPRSRYLISAATAGAASNWRISFRRFIHRRSRARFTDLSGRAYAGVWGHHRVHVHAIAMTSDETPITREAHACPLVKSARETIVSPLRREFLWRKSRTRSSYTMSSGGEWKRDFVRASLNWYYFAWFIMLDLYFSPSVRRD